MYLFIQSRYSRLYWAEKFYPISPKTYNETPQFQRKSVLCKQINNILLCSPIENANIKTYYFFFSQVIPSQNSISQQRISRCTPCFFLSYVIIFFSKFWSSLKKPLGLIQKFPSRYQPHECIKFRGSYNSPNQCSIKVNHSFRSNDTITGSNQVMTSLLPQPNGHVHHFLLQR